MNSDPSDIHNDTTLPPRKENAFPKEMQFSPGEFVSHFRIDSFLGYGGMGTVYKAHDTALHRFVALKILRLDDPENIARFTQEARAQAKVAHPNICEIYEVGDWQGRPYIAMRYIQGATLTKASTEMTLEGKVKVLFEVAGAIQEAHKRGLIHRDLKPANVIVEKSAEGEWIPYVLDFGLAKDVSTPGLTATGILIGTPSYMAPEQARGEVRSLDRRTDVYALGATLYELLGGRPPFSAESMVATLLKILNEEPAPLESINSSVPQDLETIVMKCLEKDPERRYDSARALGQDLHRFLEGEPILARPASITYRSAKWIQKRKALSAVTVAAALALLILGVMYFREKIHAGKTTRIAQQFGLEVREIEASMRREHLAEIHNTEPARNLVRSKMVSIEKTIQQMGDIAGGPGYYALGRGHLSLGETEQAENALNKAWQTYGYREPEVAYALGLSLALRYQEETAQAERITNKTARELRIENIRKNYGEPALQYIQHGKGSSEATEYVEALMAYVKRDYKGALESSQKALDKVPWQYEGELLAGDVHHSIAQEAVNRGETQQAAHSYEAAKTAYLRAIRQGESDERTYLALCGLGSDQIQMMVHSTGEDPSAVYRETLQVCKQALLVNSKEVKGYQGIARLETRWAENLINNGVDPRDVLKDASNVLTTALTLEPDNRSSHEVMAGTLLTLADYEQYRGLDPGTSLKQAIDHYGKVVSADPTSIVAFCNMGIAYDILADNQMGRGLDPRDSVDRAVVSYQRALKISNQIIPAYNGTGNAYVTKASYELNHGLDTSESTRNAETSFQQAIALNPGYVYALMNLAQAHRIQARHLLLKGDDPGADLNSAVDSLQKTLKLNPGLSYAYGALAHAYITWAEYELLRGRPPEDYLAQASSCLEKELKSNPEDFLIYSLQGTIELIQGRRQIQISKSPEAMFSSASKLFQHALQLSGRNADEFANLAESYRLTAEWRIVSRHQSAPPEIDLGLRSAEQALAIDPGHAHALAEAGVLYSLHSQVEEKSHGRDLLQKAIQSNPLLKSEYEKYLNTNLARP